jgi:hypothetical protein
MKRFVLASALAAVLGHSNGAQASWSYHIPTSVAGFFDAAHSVQYVVYIDAFGQTSVLKYSSGAWSSAVITNMYSAYNCVAGSPMFAFFDGAQGHVYCNDKHRHLLEYLGDPPTSITDVTAATGGGTVWGLSETYTSCEYVDPPQCFNLPGVAYTSSLGGYYGAGEAHVFYPAADSALHEAYYAGGWHDRVIAGLSSPYEKPGQFYTSSGQGLSGLWDGSTGHVYYVGDDGQFYQLYNNGNWWSTTLAPPGDIPYGFVSSSSPGNGQQYVYGASATNGRADIFEFVSGWNEYNVSESSLTTDGPDLSYDAAGNIQYFYVGSNQHVYDGNLGYDITAHLGAPLVSYDGALPSPPSGETYIGLSRMTGYWDGGCRHLFYVASDSHVHEMYSCASSGTGWAEHDIMPSAQVPAAD